MKAITPRLSIDIPNIKSTNADINSASNSNILFSYKQKMQSTGTALCISKVNNYIAVYARNALSPRAIPQTPDLTTSTISLASSIVAIKASSFAPAPVN